MVFDYFKAKRMLKMPIYLSEDYPLRTIKLQSSDASMKMRKYG